MKKSICFILVFLTSFLILAQEIQHEAVAVNIEVPVRVFRVNRFISNLTIKDFEVYEDGVIQKIDAVYLIQKTDIKREEAEIGPEEARQRFAPQVARSFILIFEIADYLSKITEAVDYFFENVIAPGDSLMVVTPIKSYNFKKESLHRLSREKIVDQLTSLIRTDITLGTSQYKNLINEYMKIYRTDFPMDLKLSMLKEKIRELKASRYLNEGKFQEFAEYLKQIEGQKNIFFFYQKEQLPIPPLDPTSLEYLDFWSELVSFHSFDINSVKQAYSDSSISIHFLYITKTENQANPLNVEQFGRRGMDLADMSIDIYSIFQTMAKTTGGLTESSANAAAAFKKASDAAENYYLLYYTPKDYQADGKFRKIKVKVSGRNYRIIHRAGYIAD